MADIEYYQLIQSKRKAINALLPYAVRQEKDGQPEMFNAFLHVARASRRLKFKWDRVRQYTRTLLSSASPHALTLASPHIHWDFFMDGGDLVQQWAVACSAVPYTEEVAQSVVNTLLQIASQDASLPHIPTDIWSWLTKQPSLPPIRCGYDIGAYLHVVKAVRSLGDIEIIKCYFLLIWSEWDPLMTTVFDEVCTSVHEDFGGVGNSSHQAELIQHLDYILVWLGKGLKQLQHDNPSLGEHNFQTMKYQYRKLKDILLEISAKVIACKSYPILLCILTQVETHRNTYNIYVYTPTLISAFLDIETSTLLIPLPCIIFT